MKGVRFLNKLKKITNFRFSTVKPMESKPEKELPPPTEEDFYKVDIRIGDITECWKHPESENLYCEKINIGVEVRQIGSGLQKYVPLPSMAGLVLVVANLKPRKLAGFESNGMVMAASNQDHTIIELLRPAAGSQVGERIYLEGGKVGEEGVVEKLQPVLNPKHKILEKVLPGLKTNEEGEAVFNGKRLVSKSGVVKADTLKNANIS